ESATLREAHGHDDHGHDDHGHDHHADGDAAHGRLPNSFVRTDSGALGLSWIGDSGFIGIGQSLFNTRYGMPGHVHVEDDGHGDHVHDHDHAHDHDHGGDHGVRIAMDQRRTEVRGGLDDIGPFQSLRARVAWTDYTHTEYE